MSAIQEARDLIRARALKRGEVLSVGRSLGLRVQWEIFDKVPLTGDVAWVKANRPDFEHPNVQIDGVRIDWSIATAKGNGAAK